MYNVENIEIKQLKPYKNNAKKHPKEQVERIANSIKEFGFTQPVLVDKDNCVIAGHGRILGAKKVGLKQVPVVRLEELTEEQVKAYRLIDNELNESEWDYELVENELGELLNTDIDMKLFGFDSEEELTVMGVQRHDTDDYKYKHVLITFRKGDRRYDEFISMCRERELDYEESKN